MSGFQMSIPLTYRMTQGFVASLCALAGLPLVIPCYTQICRRAPQLEMPLRRATEYQGPLNIVVDSTGVKVNGKYGNMGHRSVARGRSCI